MPAELLERLLLLLLLYCLWLCVGSAVPESVRELSDCEVRTDTLVVRCEATEQAAALTDTDLRAIGVTRATGGVGTLTLAVDVAGGVCCVEADLVDTFLS